MTVLTAFGSKMVVILGKYDGFHDLSWMLFLCTVKTSIISGVIALIGWINTLNRG